MGKHSEWRKLAKKARRKRIRTMLAKRREELEETDRKKKESSPSYQARIAQEMEEQRMEEERDARLIAEQELLWQKVEAEAQKQFKLLQQKIALAREEKARQNEQIKLEWEKDRQKDEERKERERQEIEDKLRQQEILNQQVNEFLEYGGDTPEHLYTTMESNPNKEPCPFFQKTSTCRFFDVCSRNHQRPGISRIILIPNFFTHYSLEKTDNEQHTDTNLEFENSETYEYYRDFFYDIISEFQKHGSIKLVKTCCNHEAHLRGNVFIEYTSTRAALKCYRAINGRWYAGKQLSAEFCNIPSWKNAICGLYYTKRCPKGDSCNFLHVFNNPRNLYCNFEYSHESARHRDRHSSSRNWRWSESPERLPLVDRDDRNKSRQSSRSRSKSKTRSKHHRKRSWSKSSPRKKKMFRS